VDTGLDENEAELGVLVLAVALEMLADGNSLLDKHVEIWDPSQYDVEPNVGAGLFKPSGISGARPKS
jgi:hypothetical protein